jgi:hypothetical protein
MFTKVAISSHGEDRISHQPVPYAVRIFHQEHKQLSHDRRSASSEKRLKSGKGRRCTIHAEMKREEAEAIAPKRRDKPKERLAGTGKSQRPDLMTTAQEPLTVGHIGSGDHLELDEMRDLYLTRLCGRRKPALIPTSTTTPTCWLDTPPISEQRPPRRPGNPATGSELLSRPPAHFSILR